MKRNKIVIAVLFFIFLWLFGGNHNHIKDGLDYKLLVRMIPTTEIDTEEEIISENKTILFWGRFYDGNHFNDYCIEENTMDFCKYKCRYTVDQNDFDSSDAIVIHGRETADMKLPRYRWEKQRFVFLMFESPAHSFIDISGWNNIINWTMTYRSDSDVPIPYGRIIPRQSNDIPGIEEESYLPAHEHFRMKKLIAWAASNCYIDSSKRNQLVKRIGQYLRIDMYGGCGKLKCVKTQQKTTDQCRIPTECHEYLGIRYKFYLALENSLCNEYITEKFFNALKFGMIPVVYGPDRKYYEAIGPPNSFIHVNDFSSVKALTTYLLHVGSTFSEYTKYFMWRKFFAVEEIGVFPAAWCSLCEKLHTLSNTPPKSYKSVRNWWYNGSEPVTDICSTPLLNAHGTFN